MNYFRRLADRSGLSVSPRGAVAPMAKPVAAISPGSQSEAGAQPPPPGASLAELPIATAAAISAGDQPGERPPSLETSLAETPTFDAPAIVLAASGLPSATGPAAAAPTPFEPMTAMPATASEGRLPTQQHIVEPSAPARRIERETVSPAPEWEALVPAAQVQGSPRNQQTIAPLNPRKIDPEALSAAERQIVFDVSASRMDGETVSNFRAPSSQAAAVEPAIPAADIEVPQRAGTSTASKVGAGAEHAAAQIASRLRPAQPPESEEDIAIPVPALRVAPAAGRSREDRAATAPRHDRTATATSRAQAGQGTRDASVEVRIGAVTLQVHAPAAPAALQAPRYSFAPHRHYLRTW